MAQANYESGVKEQEVKSRMPAQELELKRLALIVEGMKHFGQAAWRHPEEMQSFMNQLKPYMRLAPMTAHDLQDIVKTEMHQKYELHHLQVPGTPDHAGGLQ